MPTNLWEYLLEILITTEIVDVALCSSNDEKVFWYRNDGTGSFARRVIDPIMEKPLKLVMNDFDQDGEMDFLVIGGDTAEAVVLETGLGNSQFEREILFRGKIPTDLVLVDWDQNGTSDVLVSFGVIGSTSSPKLDILLFSNQGDGTFIQTPLLSLEERTFALEVFDLDDDGDQDLILGTDNSFGISLGSLFFALQENGVLSDPISLDTRFGEIVDIEARFLNSDGLVDILYANFLDNELAWLTLDSIPGVVIEIPEDTTNTDTTIIDTIGVSIKKSLTEIPLEIFPNPTPDYTTLSFPFDTKESYEMVILDMQGRVLRRIPVPVEAVATQKIQLDLTNLSSGKYFILIKTGIHYLAIGSLVKNPE